MTADPRRFAPSAARNRDAILEVLARHLPAQGLVLEIASGTGEHVAHFASALPGLLFQPSDPDAEARASIDAWVAHAGRRNMRPAIALDAASTDWPIARADAIFCANMIHIAPWATAIGLVRGAGRTLEPGGLLLIYGPFKQGGQHTAPSNAAFDATLQARNPDWGVRDLEAVSALAAEAGLASALVESMPANNLCLLYRRKPDVRA